MELNVDGERVWNTCFWVITPKGWGLQGDQTSQSWRKSTLNIRWKDYWSWSSNTLANWSEEPTHWKRPWCWERLRAGEVVGNRERDGWMASLTQWTWVWANSERQWRTGKLGVLQSNPWGCKELDTTDWAHAPTHILGKFPSVIGFKESVNHQGT